MSLAPVVSIIIPTYNRAKTLKRAVDSVLNQTFSNFELIVVDDCSTDTTIDVIKEYTDSRLVYINHDRNRGEGSSRNTGILNSCGKYIAFLDSDDKWFPNKLEKQISAIRKCDSKVGVIYSHSIMQTEDGNNAKIQRPSIRGDILGDLLSGKCPAISSSAIIKRECFDNHLHDERLPSFQDWDLWLQIAQNYHFEYIAEPLCVIYLGTPIQATRNIEARLDGLNLFLEKWGDLIVERFGKKQVAKIRDINITALYAVIRENMKAGDRIGAIKMFVKLTLRTDSLYRGPLERSTIAYNLLLLIIGVKHHDVLVQFAKSPR